MNGIFICRRFILCITLSSSVYAFGNDPIDFGRSIRPLLAEKCFACHGLDEASRETDMRLDTKEGLFAELDSGGFTVKPNDPAQSEIYKRLVTTDEDERMPPADFGKQMTAQEIDLIQKWISDATGP